PPDGGPAALASHGHRCWAYSSRARATSSAASRPRAPEPDQATARRRRGAPGRAQAVLRKWSPSGACAKVRRNAGATSARVYSEIRGCVQNTGDGILTEEISEDAETNRELAPARDAQYRARDVGRRIRQQEQDRLGNLLDGAGAA